MRTVLGTFLGTACLLVAGCTPKAKADAPASPPRTPALALPVVAPIQARDRLLQDMEQQKAAARARKAEFDAVIAGRDH